MEAQMKRGFLEACVLAAVSGEESYGYQIVKDVPASIGAHGVDALPAAQAPGEGRVHHGALRRAQRAAAPVLPHHGRRASAHRGVPGRVAVRTGDLRIR